MFRSLAKPPMVLTRTHSPSKSHHTTDVCGYPSRVIVDRAATGGHSTRSRCESGTSFAAGSLTRPIVGIGSALTPRSRRSSSQLALGKLLGLAFLPLGSEQPVVEKDRGRMSGQPDSPADGGERDPPEGRAHDPVEDRQSADHDDIHRHVDVEL